MPHINRVRVNNVKYNFGTQFYDDFILRFDGRNALYDLANGGGKSVLMLLLFQNLIPNCTLDEKQPIEKLFRTDQGSTVIHSLIEWQLDDRFVYNGRKYMLTGFCARKAKEEKRETAAVEYFNYVVFYPGYNDNDIVNLPLSDGKERITYTGLKSYLKELSKKDMSLDVHLFERKGEYQRFISRYGLYESQWEIIRGINQTEGHVRTYFENHYKTTRKVVEDLLIEEIIQKAYEDPEKRGSDDMAQTLMEIKDKLLELSRRKEEISHYDSQAEILQSFAGRVDTLNTFYSESEIWKDDLVKTYNTAAARSRKKKKELDVAEKEKAFCEKHLNEIGRRLDTAKVQADRARLAELEKQEMADEENIRKMKDEIQIRMGELQTAENMNDYLEYAELDGKCQSIRTFLGQDQSSRDHILSALQAMAGQKFHADKKQKQILNRKIWNIEKSYGETSEIARESQEEERKLDNHQAVLESRKNELDKELRRYRAEFANVRKQVPVLLLENLSQACGQKKRDVDVHLKAVQEAMKERQDRSEQQIRLTASLSHRQDIIDNLQQRRKSLDDFLETYQKEKEKCDKLFKVYDVSELSSLEQTIRERLRKVISDSEKKQEALENGKERLRQLSQDLLAVPGKQAQAIMEYIRRCHGMTCVFGSDYLKDAGDYDRNVLLKQMPFLPCAIIVKEGIRKLREDRVFIEKDFGDGTVPVIGLDTVMSQASVLDGEKVLFISRDPKIFTESARREERKAALEKQIQDMEKQCKRLRDNEQTMEKDYQYAVFFRTVYHKKYMEVMADMEPLTAELEEALSARQKEQESLKTIQLDNEKLSEFIRETTRTAEEEQKELEALSKLHTLDETIQDLERQSEQVKKQTEKNAGLLERLGEKLRWARQTLQQLEKQKSVLREETAGIDQRWQSIYAPYHVPEEDLPQGETDSQIDLDSKNQKNDPENIEEGNLAETDGAAFEARFIGLKEAYEKEHADMQDKTRLLQSYLQMMDKLKRLMLNRGSEPESLKKQAQETPFGRTSEEQLSEWRSWIRDRQKAADGAGEKLDQLKAEKNRIFGSVQHGIAAIEEKYGSFKEVDISQMDFADYISGQKEALSQMKAKYVRAGQNIDRLFREMHSEEDVRRDIERMIRHEGIRFNRTGELYPMDTNLFGKYRELTDRFQKLRQDGMRRKEMFEQDREKAASSMSLLGAAELADMLRHEVTVPVSGEEARDLKERLLETVQIIRIEKERIEKTIQNMVQIKQNFEKQCLQRCRSMKTELDRFASYSRIVLDGREIPMVVLKIPYVPEETFESRMSEYIDDIVGQADQYTQSEERMRYIRRQLSWKRLFSVIVSDMNSIRLSLYKRERIKEQSRYLKYEEAVGSTGQSQGIYIQFLIAVINYIATIYSGHGQESTLKKVLFIDNPFGAAKDIYIWQPIFELLRTNHVQLIVPTRGATPAITGKFDVNYILGQRMVDHMQQTVVVDYSSNVDIEQMEYVKMDFEQEVFDFL